MSACEVCGGERDARTRTDYPELSSSDLARWIEWICPNCARRIGQRAQAPLEATQRPLRASAATGHGAGTTT
jgi:hypothetical protein